MAPVLASLSIPSYLDRKPPVNPSLSPVAAPPSPTRSMNLVTYYSVNVELADGSRWAVDRRYSEFKELYASCMKLGSFKNKRGSGYSFPKKEWGFTPGPCEIKDRRRESFEAMLAILLQEHENSTAMVLEKFLEVEEHRSLKLKRDSNSIHGTPKFKPYETKGTSPISRGTPRFSAIDSLNNDVKKRPSGTMLLPTLFIVLFAAFVVKFASVETVMATEAKIIGIKDMLLELYAVLIAKLTGLPVPGQVNGLSEGQTPETIMDTVSTTVGGYYEYMLGR